MANKCYSKTQILLPDFSKVDPYKWSVIACDQFTSEPEYWEKVKSEVGDSPSTLNITLPEVYLDKSSELIPKINAIKSGFKRIFLIEILFLSPEIK